MSAGQTGEERQRIQNGVPNDRHRRTTSYFFHVFILLYYFIFMLWTAGCLNCCHAFVGNPHIHIHTIHAVEQEIIVLLVVVLLLLLCLCDNVLTTWPSLAVDVVDGPRRDVNVLFSVNS